MSTTDHTREELADLLSQVEVSEDHMLVSLGEPYYSLDETGSEQMAEAILASPWLAAHVAAVVEGKDAEIERAYDTGLRDGRKQTVAAERERIATAIEAERDDKPAGLPDSAIVLAYQGGLNEAARIARSTTDGGDTTPPVDVERIRAAIRLVQPDHLTPVGARIIEQALGGDTDD